MESPENSVSFRIGGTIRLRWLATLAVMHRFRWHFSIAIAMWIVVGAYFGQAALHAELACLLIVPIACNVLGIDPAQLFMRGTVTFSPAEVYWTDIWGRTRPRGWDWVRKAEEVDGKLHIVFGLHRSRAVAIKGYVQPSTYHGLRDVLIAQGKLAT